MSKSGFKVTYDGMKKFAEDMKAFKAKEILVGIPEDKSARKDDDEDEDETVTNAQLGYIHNYGSPARNIPARPFMEPGIKHIQKEIVDEFKHTARQVFVSGADALTEGYNRVGILAQNSVKKVIVNQEGFKGLEDKTIEARKAKGFKGKKALIRTGQLLNSITYVIRDKKRGKD